MVLLSPCALETFKLFIDRLWKLSLSPFGCIKFLIQIYPKVNTVFHACRRVPAMVHDQRRYSLFQKCSVVVHLLWHYKAYDLRLSHISSILSSILLINERCNQIKWSTSDVSIYYFVCLVSDQCLGSYIF